MNKNKDLKVAEVAEIFQVDQKTVRRWIRLGLLAAYRLPNRSIRVTPAALDEFRTKNQIKPKVKK